MPAWQPPGARETLAWVVPLLGVLLALYAATAPRTVVLEDDGEFVTAVHLLGIAHPPGFPLFVLLAKPFTWLPVGSIAFRVHLASSFFAAAAAGFLWWTARTLLGSAAIAWTAALAFGVSDAFWSQALIADVYSLNAAAFFALLCLCIAYAQEPRSARLGLLAFAAGLGLCNHWPLLSMAAPGLAPILWPARAAIGRDLLRRPHYTVLPFAAGLLPYLWMVVRSQSAPQLGFYGSIGSWGELWHYVSRAGYAHVESDPAAGSGDQLRFAGFLLRECVAQYGVLGAAVIVVGFAAQRRRWSANVGLGLSLTFFAVVAGLAALVGFPYEYFTRAIFRPYPLIAYGVLALWLGLGLAEIRRWAASWHRRLAPAAWLLPAAAILSLGFHGGLRANDRHAYRYSRDYAETLLGSFAPDAVVVGYGDVESFTFGYYHFVEGVRPDVRLLNERALGAALDGRLFDPRYATPRDTVVHATRLVRETDRPVYFFTTPPFSFGDADYGFYYQVDRTQNERTSLELTDELVDLYRRIVSEDEHTDRWTVHHRYRVVKRFAATLAAVLALGGEDMRERYGVDLDQASVEFAGAWADLWFHYGQGSLDQRQLLDRLERAESLVDEVVPRRDLAALYLLKGRVLKGLGRNDEAVAALRRSVEMRPAPDNEAFADLRRLEEAPAPGTSR